MPLALPLADQRSLSSRRAQHWRETIWPLGLARRPLRSPAAAPERSRHRLRQPRSATAGLPAVRLRPSTRSVSNPPVERQVTLPSSTVFDQQPDGVMLETCAWRLTPPSPD